MALEPSPLAPILQTNLDSTQNTLPESAPFKPPPLPHPFNNSFPAPKILGHGAEALVYKTSFLTAQNECILKHRPKKSWRHPILDARLTRHRILAEARILVRARQEGVPVPAVLALDADLGWMCVEFVGNVYGRAGCGVTVREGLERWRRRSVSRARTAAAGVAEMEGLDEVRALLKRIGQAVGALHKVNLVHGDLTSSNLMLRSTLDSQPEHPMTNGHSADSESEDSIKLSGEVVLIDFGLASTTLAEEDRAVDLYVLERAMGSTHPWLEEEFGLMLDGYKGSYKGANSTLKRLEDVRMRGRKKSMLG